MEYLAALTPVPPYNFDLTLDILRRFVTPVLDIAGHDRAYWRVLRSGAGLALLRIAPSFELFLAAHIGEIDRTRLIADVSHILAVDEDPKPFYAAAQTHPELWQVIAPVHGIRWLRSASVFEALMMVIIEQHIAWTTALRAQEWLVRWGGAKIRHNGRDFYAFPTPAQIANASIEDLSPLKITFKRMQIMITIAQQIEGGKLDLEALRNFSAEEAYTALMALPGVGHWTAANVVSRALGHFRYITDTDVAIQNAANFYFNNAKGRLSPQAMRQLFERYGTYGAAAAYHTLLRWVIDRYPVRDDAHF